MSPHAATLRVDPVGLGVDDLAELLGDHPAYRARQVHAWLVRGIEDPADMTDLPRTLRGELAQRFVAPPEVVSRSVADDGLTHKLLLRFGDGEAIESVLMLYPRTADRAGRATVCISTQAGCAMGCPFCATGQAGFRRQLGVGEVVRQVSAMQRLLRTGEIAVPGAPSHVTNVVFMGMGEPLANLAVTEAAVRWLHDPDGFGLSARAITVSTVGLVPGIRRLSDLGLPITLAVSLHAATDALRDDLVPVNRTHPLGELLDAAAEYRHRTGRRLTFEYILIAGINDALADARALAELVGDLDAHVNLIPMNPTPAVPWDAPAPSHQRAFLRVLETAGVPATLRHNRGGAIDGACGQLYASYAVASGRMLPSARDAWQAWQPLADVVAVGDDARASHGAGAGAGGDASGVGRQRGGGAS